MADTPLVIRFHDIGKDDLGLVGGKGLNLGVLAQAGIRVPPGCCVTTAAFARFVANDPVYQELMAGLADLAADDLEAVHAHGARLREHLQARPIPDEVRTAVIRAWRELGEAERYAVRSSATAEDLPSASFAGQQDTYLNVRGQDAILERVRACWASLYTDRAIVYRTKQGIAHDQVSLCAVVQIMIGADKAGILFTADPVTGHRKIAAIDASFGLGEAVVSGVVSPDLYKVDTRTGALVSVTVGHKNVAIMAAEQGGTTVRELPLDMQSRRVLDEREIAELVAVGQRIESLRGSPQDIEWCIEHGVLHVVQARPITSLYPVPRPVPGPAPEDPWLHVYVCFNHFQVMTDAMSPMALSAWELMLPFAKSQGQGLYCPWARTAGGRLYIDISEVLRFTPMRKAVPVLLRNFDGLTAGAIAEVMKRESFQHGPRLGAWQVVRALAPLFMRMLVQLWVADPGHTASRTIRQLDALAAELEGRITAPRDTAERLRQAREVVGTLMDRVLFAPARIAAGMVAGHVLRRFSIVQPRDMDALGRGLRGNVTTDMDLAVGDLADCARAYSELRAWLVAGAGSPDDLAGELARLPGGPAFKAELDRFLGRYGMRAPSEIDMARPRWHDDPRLILRVVAGNLAHDHAGEHRSRHEALAREAEDVARALVERAGRGVLGWLRKRLVRRLIRVFRELGALREHPKFFLVQVFDTMRGAIMDAAAVLHGQGRLAAVDDVWWLGLDELIDALEEPRRQVRELVAARRAEYERYQAMFPPRVLTSDGEIVRAEHDTAGVPAGALVGSPASAGEVVGIARVIRDPTAEVLGKGEILVAPFTDPGWTPLFLNAAGLVMEVGGLMTHGSVVAREYGIPAVVCVPEATTRICTGQRIRVQGDLGYVEILGDPAPAQSTNRRPATGTSSS